MMISKRRLQLIYRILEISIAIGMLLITIKCALD